LAFWDGFSKRFGRSPVYTAPGAYDAVHIYAEAVTRAKSVEPEAVIKELEKTDYVGIPGRIVFDELHDVKSGPGFVNFLFAQWQENGDRTVVWPKEVASGKMISPPWMQR
jgi:branched-chain amino acid transport system substrate-binding protein